MIIWYLNNSDGVEEADVGLSVDAVTPAMLERFIKNYVYDCVRAGCWIDEYTWIPPHRILRIDVG